MTDKQSAIVNLFNLFPEPIPKPKSFDDLFDCSTVIGIYQYFSGKEINIPEMKDWFARMKATKTAFEEMSKVLDGIGKVRTCDLPALTRRKSVDDMERFTLSLIDYGLQSDKKEELRRNISKLTQEEQNIIKGMLEVEIKEKISYLSDDLKKIKEAIEKLKKDDDDLEKGNENLKRENDELKKGNENLKRENDELKKGNENLKKENDELKKGYENLKKEIDEIKNLIMKKM